MDARDLRVKCKNRKYGFVVNVCDWVIEPKFKTAYNFCEGYAAVNLRGKYGYIRPDGSWHIERQFDDAKSFHEGRAAVYLHRKWGFIKLDGSWLVEPKFDEAKAFDGGLAHARINEIMYELDIEGNYTPMFDTATRSTIAVRSAKTANVTM